MSVILSCSPEAKEKALADGFKEQTVLVKWEGIRSDDARRKSQRESQIMNAIRPNQFFVGDFWGAGPD